MGKPTICIGENKDADQLRGNREADQRLCFRYSDSTIPLLLNSEISSFELFPVLVQPDLCRTCSETTLLVFLRGGSNIELFFNNRSSSESKTSFFRIFQLVKMLNFPFLRHIYTISFVTRHLIYQRTRPHILTKFLWRWA